MYDQGRDIKIARFIASALCCIPATIAVAAPQAYTITIIDDQNLGVTHYHYGVGINDANTIVSNTAARNIDTPHTRVPCSDSSTLNKVFCLVETIHQPFVANSFPVTASLSAPTFAYNLLTNATIDATDPAAWQPENQAVENYPSSTMTVFGMDAATDNFVGDVVAQHQKKENSYYRDYEQRAFLQSGGTTTLLPPNVIDYNGVALGGESGARAITGSYVVGFVGHELTSAAKAQVDACRQASSDIATQQVCVQEHQLLDRDAKATIQYHDRAALWDSGTLQTLTFPAQSTFPNGQYPAESKAIGQAVHEDAGQVWVAGSSHAQNKYHSKPYEIGAYWQDALTNGGKLSFIYYDRDMERSTLQAIADDPTNTPEYNKVMVGHYVQTIARSNMNRYKPFYYRAAAVDIADADKKARFFRLKGLSTDNDLDAAVFDINSNLQIVGYMDANLGRSVSRARQQSALLYEINDINNANDDVLYDLNNLLTCDAKGFQQDGSAVQISVTQGTETYTYDASVRVVHARSINDQGYIVATAAVRVPVYKEAPLKEGIQFPFIASTKNYLIKDGKLQTQERFQTVILTPSSTATPCPHSVLLDDEQRTTNYKRRGAGYMSAMSIAFLCLMVFWRFNVAEQFVRLRYKRLFKKIR